jgi:hypothetical protein
MRSYKLTSATLAAALLALGTSGVASAHPPRHLGSNGTAGPCAISLEVAPRLLTSGETALAHGVAQCASTTPETVTLYQRVAGSPGFAVAGTATTEAGGGYQITTAPQTTNSVLYAAVGSARSHARALKVAAQVTLVGPPETKQLFAGIKTGRRNAVIFTGEVSPDEKGATLILQRQNAIRGNEWHMIGRTIVDAEGKFAITHDFVVPGASDIRVLVRANRRNVAGRSNVLSYEISQAQNPSLTILSATDPVPYGGSTVISGTLAGSPDTTVTLMGHPAGGPLVAVATTKTDGEGNYSFPAQTPLTSMFYKVTGAGRSSALLYEGVKYVLTASVLSSTITSGSPVVFNGTVTPIDAGHAIYIERQNLSGTGFHVIATGTVNADGTYSLSHILYTPGTEVLRVKVPGDPGNAGTASSPFTITVNPLAAAKIGPEPAGNSTLPPEGTV